MHEWLPLRAGRNRRTDAGRLAGVRRVAGAGMRQVPHALAFVAGTLAVALGTCGALSFWDRLVHHERLGVAQIVVAGLPQAKRTPGAPPPQPTREQILAYAEVPLGAPILLVDPKAMAQRITRHPWVRQATVSRQLPSRLVVQVEAQQPRLLVALKELYVAAGDGELFKNFSAADRLDLPVVTGLTTVGPGLQVKQSVQDAVALCDAMAKHPMVISSLDELHWDADVGWSAVLQTMTGGGGVRLHLGKTPHQRLPQALGTLRYLMEKSQTPAVIWADGGKNPQRVQVRLAEPAALLSQRGLHGTKS